MFQIKRQEEHGSKCHSDPRLDPVLKDGLERTLLEEYTKLGSEYQGS